MLARLARRGIVTSADLRAAGLSRAAIARRVESKRLFARYRGVYSLAEALPPLGREQAALLATGPEGALAGASATFVFGMSPESVWPVHVVVPGRRRRPQRGLHLHYDAVDDVRTRYGLRVVAPHEALRQLATGLPAERLELLVADALRRGLTTVADLTRAAATPRPGAPVLRALLQAGPIFTRSQMERLARRLVEAAGVPAPQFNHRVGGRELDLHWPELGLVVEIDGWSSHGDPIAFEADRRRDQETRLRTGLPPLRITARQLQREPGWVAHVLRAEVERARRAA